MERDVQRGIPESVVHPDEESVKYVRSLMCKLRRELDGKGVQQQDRKDSAGGAS